jgi:superfamily I DNA and RNA helicase
MGTDYFYSGVVESEINKGLLDALSAYAEEQKKQVYVVDKPLGTKKYNYDYQTGFIILIPGYKLLFVDYSVLEDAQTQQDEFFEDFVEDVGSLSDKFEYRKVIGRPRVWREALTHKKAKVNAENILSFLNECELQDEVGRRNVALLISLIISSINDINQVKEELPTALLDKVKQKIVLFDGLQSRFIYSSNDDSRRKKRTKIQGLSGTGKTELLLHKLKELYTENESNKILFTCFNKVLAHTLNTRIPKFFDFMRVEQQITQERLTCVHSYGSRGVRYSGAYAFITTHYGLDFSSYNSSVHNHFDKICKHAIEQLTVIKQQQGSAFQYAFDYILIDESQDFPDSFFDLCDLVTKHEIYIAGDIFQDIFDQSSTRTAEVDFLLSKCYRTDPKTLMFAQALSLGLFENPALKWLADDQWTKCGYQFEKNGEQYTFTREPLRRFEEDGTLQSNIVLSSPYALADLSTCIINTIKRIKRENSTVQPDDIAVIFLDSYDNTSKIASQLEILIRNDSDLGWPVNNAITSKESVQGKLFISNKNNVKGLEFSFVICVTQGFSQARSFRNALYMVLTRSFLQSYLILSSTGVTPTFLARIQNEASEIQSSNKLVVQKPKNMASDTLIDYDGSLQTLHDRIERILNANNVSDENVRTSIQEKMAGNGYMTDELLADAIKQYASQNFGGLF